MVNTMTAAELKTELIDAEPNKKEEILALKKFVLKDRPKNDSTLRTRLVSLLDSREENTGW